MVSSAAIPAWVWLSVAGVLFLGALALLLWGLLGDRSKGRGEVMNDECGVMNGGG